jgi:hypothetical protein
MKYIIYDNYIPLKSQALLRYNHTNLSRQICVVVPGYALEPPPFRNLSIMDLSEQPGKVFRSFPIYREAEPLLCCNPSR